MHRTAFGAQNRIGLVAGIDNNQAGTPELVLKTVNECVNVMHVMYDDFYAHMEKL